MQCIDEPTKSQHRTTLGTSRQPVRSQEIRFMISRIQGEQRVRLPLLMPLLCDDAIIALNRLANAIEAGGGK